LGPAAQPDKLLGKELGMGRSMVLGTGLGEELGSQARDVERSQVCYGTEPGKPSAIGGSFGCRR